METPPNAGEKRPAPFAWRKHIQAWIETRVLPPEMYVEVTRLVRYKNRRRPPHVYSPIGIWDDDGDAYRTIAVDVLAKLLKEGHFEKLHFEGKTDFAIQGYVLNAIRFGGSRIAKGRNPRCKQLHTKVNAVLKRPEFMHFPGLGWGLAEWTGVTWEAVTPHILWERVISVEVPMPSPDPKRRKQFVPTPEDIARFCAMFLERLRYPVLLDLLQDAAETHLNVGDDVPPCGMTYKDQETGKTKLVDYQDERQGFYEFESRDAIQKFVGNLTQTDRLYLKELFLAGKAQKELVRQGKLKRSSVSNKKRELQRKLRELGLDWRVKPSLEDYFKEAIAHRDGNGRHHDEIHGNTGKPANDRARESGRSEEAAFQASAGAHSSGSTLDD